MRALVVGGVAWNRIIHVAALPGPDPVSVPALRSHDTLGGTGAGKAWNLAALGWEVDLVASVGDDEPGESVRAAVADLGVRFDGVIDHAGTEQHTNLMDPHGGRISVFTSMPSAHLDLDVAAVVELAEAADLVVVNIIEHCRPVAMALGAAGIGFWTDLHDWDGVAEHHVGFASAATSVQLSSDRLPGWRAVGEGLIDEGVASVIVTHGAAGADANDGDGWRHADALPADVVDTNGAGDAFWAGFVNARAERLDVEASLTAGSTAAARCVGSDGLGPDR